MARRDVRSATWALLLAGACSLACVTSGAAGGIEDATSLINPSYLDPEISAHLRASCQVIVKTPLPPQYGVTSDDLLYCDLPRYASRFPSDRCACTARVAGARIPLNGSVVWRPANWGQLISAPRWPFPPW
jgi:hypothetical protein